MKLNLYSIRCEHFVDSVSVSFVKSHPLLIGILTHKSYIRNKSVAYVF